MPKYFKKFNVHSEYVAYMNSGNALIPNVSYCEGQDEMHYTPIHDYSKDYLTTVALENGTISFNVLSTMNTDKITSISYSTDDGATWTTTNNTNSKGSNLVITVNVSNGDKVLWKGEADQIGYDDDEDGYIGSFFSSTADFNAEGNVMSLCYGDNFEGEDELDYSAQFASLFINSDVVNANNLILPATTLTEGCYCGMFSGCSSLETSPNFPATTMQSKCYYEMFKNCASLTAAPELPATTMGATCYGSMFNGCTALTTAPELPCATMVDTCYRGMFFGCTALTTPPALNATTLDFGCYYNMFRGCTALTTAPVLPATTLASRCYETMFYGCSSLNYIKAMFTTTPSTSYTKDWVSGVAATGTFVKNSSAAWNVSGVNGVPSGWTTQTASE